MRGLLLKATRRKPDAREQVVAVPNRQLMNHTTLSLCTTLYLRTAKKGTAKTGNRVSIGWMCAGSQSITALSAGKLDKGAQTRYAAVEDSGRIADYHGIDLIGNR